MNNPLAGTDPSGYRSICGGKNQRSCDQIVDYTGNNQGMSTDVMGGVVKVNGASNSSGAKSVTKDSVADLISQLDLMAEQVANMTLPSEAPLESSTGSEGFGSKLTRLFFPATTFMREKGVEGTWGDAAKGYFKEAYNSGVGFAQVITSGSVIGVLAQFIPVAKIKPEEASGAALFELGSYAAGGIVSAETAFLKAMSRVSVSKTVTVRTGPRGVDPNHHNANVMVRDADGNILSHERIVSGNMTPTEKALGFPKNTLASHTEARAVTHTALKQGDTMTITGQLPPCNSCKGYMNRAVNETGANIKYQWRQDGKTQTWLAGKKR
ncbi:hypothetical protein FLL45_06230 [Aliikangiella marina]|uniref:Uncharacterized protein n=2 Tax=Aliikangiella marina TaxID=1712262 RepID=A0A545TEF8_9GAMM|nr:hypothetical protein FLL45_06230 [Aliikangiella marina]